MHLFKTHDKIELESEAEVGSGIIQETFDKSFQLCSIN